MVLSQNDLIKIANYFKEYLLNIEYSEFHLSYQLAQTTQVVVNADSVSVVIPAQIYDLNKFRFEGVIVHTNEGSYASENDKEGGFSGVHVGYIERAIKYALRKWWQVEQIEESEVDMIWN